MSLDVAISVEAAGWGDVPDVENLAARVLDHAASRSGEPLRDGAELSVLLCDDAAIRVLNRDWRGMDKPTNVLSFPAPGKIGVRPILGDIAVAWETTLREARAESKPVAEHLSHLLVHGLLHLVGHDHEAEAEAEAMERLETAILAELGIADPYRDPAPERAAS